jgi:hypothetical protein
MASSDMDVMVERGSWYCTVLEELAHSVTLFRTEQITDKTGQTEIGSDTASSHSPRSTSVS